MCSGEKDKFTTLFDISILVRFINDRLGMSTTLLKGTPGYIAPELYEFTEKGSPYAVDIWAVGEMAFQMLTKQPTFKNPRLVVDYVNKPKTFPSVLLLDAQVSQPGVEFILSAMRPIPVDRITAEKALHHRWMDHPLSRDHSSATPVYKKAPISTATDSIMTGEEFALSCRRLTRRLQCP
jgi:serine/threonine protein kinase